MEASSPLAAMQPPSLPGPFSRHYDGPPQFTCNFLRPQCDVKNFNFRDLSMSRPVQRCNDYFSWKPVRGSSPTASLAADLSQNFHIDQSPQLPTPRRSLFTASNLGELNKRNVVTPPIPSSSPGPDNSTMEISPLLPHKAPHASFVQIDVCSPTPEPNPAVEDGIQMMEFGNQGCNQGSLDRPSKLSPPRRRKPSVPARPNFRKGYSTTSITLDINKGQISEPPFLFGAGAANSSKPTAQSLLESFVESPPQEKKLQSSLSSSSLLGSCRPKQPFPSNGSPVNGMRRPVGPFGRAPRSGMSRRSQSMYASNGTNTIRQEKRCCTSSAGLQSVIDVEDAHPLSLPHFQPANEPDSLPRITKGTLVDVLSGLYGSDSNETAIIDCRFEYEYSGGHIDGALNYNDKEFLANQLFEKALPETKVLIFHCEYSAHRAPIMAKFIRQRDRAINDFQYPKLTYPEIYILDGGYSSFFQSHSSRCYPQSYVEMGAKEHESACERGMAKVRQRRKLSRAHTYAFGQAPSTAEERPASRSGLESCDSMDIDTAYVFDRPLLIPRRLGSY